MYTEVYLRLEPLGLELVAAACRTAGHEVRLLDLQVLRRRHYESALDNWRPDVVGFSLNYLANIPEAIELARLARRRLPEALVIVGGHSASFTAHEILVHADGNIDCVVKGEGEAVTPRILDAWTTGKALDALPGVVTRSGEGPPPLMIKSLDDTLPARDLIDRRRKYFIGVLDPCASVEFSRGCPWNCTFCIAIALACPVALGPTPFDPVVASRPRSEFDRLKLEEEAAREAMEWRSSRRRGRDERGARLSNQFDKASAPAFM